MNTNLRKRIGKAEKTIGIGSGDPRANSYPNNFAEFKAELGWRREQVTSEAFGILSQSLTKAVEALVGLVYNEDDRLKRLAAKDIIEHFLKYKEFKKLEERIVAIERWIDTTKTGRLKLIRLTKKGKVALFGASYS